MATLEDIDNMLAALPAEERERVLESLARRYAEERDIIQEDLDYSEELRETRDPTMIDAGRFKVAASPLEFVGTGIQRGLGAYGRQRGQKAMTESVADETNLVRRLQDAFRGRAGGQLTRQIAAANALRARERGR